MHIYEILSSGKTSVAKALDRFKTSTVKSGIWRPKDDVQFVFLCGANVSDNKPSERRKSVLRFGDKNLPAAKFFLAETIFKVLKDEGYSKNWLDIETALLGFADHVVVILESESSFCELGAFAADKKLREKMIVINDQQYVEKETFITKGPVLAISEISNNKNILYYRMDKNGKLYGDGIGSIFYDLYGLINKKTETRRTRIEEYDPTDFFNKDSLRFVHDLVYFASPVSSAELNRMVRILLGRVDEHRLRIHLALLFATEEIKTKGGFYASCHKKPYFEYDSPASHNLLASFKNLYFRYDPSRLI